MNDDDRIKEALFRHAILGELLSRELRRGELRRLLTDLSARTKTTVASRIGRGQVAVSALPRLLRRRGLSGPRM